MTIPTHAYGKDAQGLICGFLLHPEIAPRELNLDDAAAWLEKNHSSENNQSSNNNQESNTPEFLWLHFNLSHTASLKWLSSHANLPQEFFDTLQEDSHSTRIEFVESTLLAVVNDVHYDFSFEGSEISTLWLSVAEKLVVSVRLRPLRSIDALRESVRHGEIIRSPIALLVHLLHEQENILVEIIRRVTLRIDSVEDKLVVGKISMNRTELGVMRRLLVRLQRLLAPEPASVFRLLQTPPEWADETDHMELRQSTEEFSVVLRDMGALQERIKLMQEELAAHVAEQNNRSLFVLTIMTVLALPINIIAGLLGMNVGGIPFAHDESGFWLVVFMIIIFTSVGTWWVFRKFKI